MEGLQLADVLIELGTLIDPKLDACDFLRLQFAAHRHARLHGAFHHLHQAAFLALSRDDRFAMAAALHQRFKIRENETSHVGGLGVASDALGLKDRCHLLRETDLQAGVEIVVVLGCVGGVLGKEAIATEAQRQGEDCEKENDLFDCSNHLDFPCLIRIPL